MELTPRELKALLDSGDPIILLDVREIDEWGLCRIEGARHIPMHELPARLAELPADLPIVCYCHHGVRSAQVQRFLLRNGYLDVRNLARGIDGWSREVDGSVPLY